MAENILTFLFNNGLFNQIPIESVSTSFSMDAYSGETQTVLNFITDPRYYTPDANNNFTFLCDYNAPIGELNFIFPDNPCGTFLHFEAYSGETATVLELLTDDWSPLVIAGEELDVVLSTFKILPIIETSTGENALIDNLITVSLFDSNSYSGEVNEWSLITYPSINLGAVTNLTGENSYTDLLTSSIVEVIHDTGEVSSFDVSFLPSEGIGILEGYSGEREDLELFTYAIFGELNAREGQNASTDLATFLPALLDAQSYSDETVLFNLSVELIIETLGTSGENAFFLFNTHPSIDLGSVANYAGQRAETFTLVTAMTLPLPFYSGEGVLLVFTDAPALEITLPFYEGGYGWLSLSTASLIDGKATTGEYGTSTLTTFIGTTFTPVFYPGTTAEATLRTLDRMVLTVATGQNTVTDLVIFPATPLYPIAYSGQTADTTLLLGITFPSSAYDGSQGTFDLDFVVNIGLPAGWYDGERADLSLSTTDTLSFIGYAGEDAWIYLGAAFALYPIAYSGEDATASLTLNLFDSIDSDGYNGHILYPTLSTTTRLPNIGFSGENIIFDLYQSLQPNIILLSYSGHTVIADIQISFQMPIGRSYAGANAVVNQIDSEPNIHFYTDEWFETTLSTNDVFKTSAMGVGEICLMVLQVGKSEGIGTFRVYPGTEMISSFDTQHHADLYVMFRTSIMTQVDMGSATYFDLNTDTCCGIRRESTSNNLLMQLFVRDYYPEAISDGDRVLFSIDLRCNPRLSMEFRNGQDFQFKEYDGFLSMNFTEGTEGVINQFDADLTHKLCKGYFIPNGNWVVVEMNDVLLEDCYTDVFYAGTELSCILSDDIVIRVSNNYCGESLTPTLSIYPPIEFIAYSGERLYTNLYILQATYPRATSGEYFQFSFYEEPFLNYTGACGECELSIEYHVRFKEIGCLDNNFTFQNESGDLIAELSNPVPVEGEPYYHSVLAECV